MFISTIPKPKHFNRALFKDRVALSLIKAVIPGPPLTPHLWKERGWSVSVLVERGNLHIKPNTDYRFLTPQADRLLHIECISSVLWFRLYVLAYNTSHGCGRAATVIYVPIHIYRSINTNYFLFLLKNVSVHILQWQPHFNHNWYCTRARPCKINSFELYSYASTQRGPKGTQEDLRGPKGT